jgi:hypothetical protein
MPERNWDYCCLSRANPNRKVYWWSGGWLYFFPLFNLYSIIYCMIKLMLSYIYYQQFSNICLNYFLHLILLTEAGAIREMRWTDNCCGNPWSQRSLDFIPGYSVFYCNFYKLTSCLCCKSFTQKDSWYYPLIHRLLWVIWLGIYNVSFERNDISTLCILSAFVN